MGSDADGTGIQTITAEVPTCELGTYAVDVRALTGGRGRLTITHDHYDVVPDHIAGKLLEGRARAAAPGQRVGAGVRQPVGVALARAQRVEDGGDGPVLRRPARRAHERAGRTQIGFV